MKKRGVLMVSGDQMGMPTYFRIGFGSHTDQLEAALVRLGRTGSTKTSRGQPLSLDLLVSLW